MHISAVGSENLQPRDHEMSVTIPLSGLQSHDIYQLEAGTFFYIVDEQFRRRDFKLVVEVNIEQRPKQGIVALDGDDKFSFGILGRVEGSERAIRIPYDNLHVCVDMDRQPAGADLRNGGNLLVTPDDALITLTRRGIGGDVHVCYLSTQTWKVTQDVPLTYAMFSRWKLISRSDRGDEIVFGVGEPPE